MPEARLDMLIFLSDYWQNSQESKVTRWYEWAGLILSGVVAMYSHNLAIFVLVVPDLFLVYQSNMENTSPACSRLR